MVEVEEKGWRVIGTRDGKVHGRFKRTHTRAHATKHKYPPYRPQLLSHSCSILESHSRKKE